MTQIENFVWMEKYRPKTINECILPAKIKETFLNFIKEGEIPNLILNGPAGTGKTTAALAMLNELDREVLVINGSLYGNIDTLRYDIKNFAQSLSLFKPGRKYVIIDEADYLNANSTQPALRNFMEEFSKNCGFILTCNYKNRIIPELHSRCAMIDYKIDKEEMPVLMKGFFERVKTILDTENVEYDDAAIARFMKAHFPDMRRLLNELQREAASGKITSAILVNVLDSNFLELVKTLKAKNFTNMRRWIGENETVDFNTLMRKIYDRMDVAIKENDRPTAIMLCAKYQYQAAFVVDQQVNTAAFLTELMANVDFE